jgi:hypothetical protein
MTIANVVSKSWTYTLVSDSILVDSDFGFTIISILCTSGTTTVLGGTAANGLASTPITLSEGQSLTINSGSASLISGITIDASSGAANIIAR